MLSWFGKCIIQYVLWHTVKIIFYKWHPVGEWIEMQNSSIRLRYDKTLSHFSEIFFCLWRMSSKFLSCYNWKIAKWISLKYTSSSRHRPPITNIHQSPVSTNYQCQPITNVNQSPVSTNHQCQPITNVHQSPKSTNHQRQPITNVNQSPTSTSRQRPPITKRPPIITSHQLPPIADFQLSQRPLITMFTSRPSTIRKRSPSIVGHILQSTTPEA
jgi:hypothetical protein